MNRRTIPRTLGPSPAKLGRGKAEHPDRAICSRCGEPADGGPYICRRCKSALTVAARQRKERDDPRALKERRARHAADNRRRRESKRPVPTAPAAPRRWDCIAMRDVMLGWMAAAGYRRCRRCSLWKGMEDFSPKAKFCRPCLNAYMREWRAAETPPREEWHPAREWWSGLTREQRIEHARKIQNGKRRSVE